jgi:hypothetical protein
MTTRPALLAVCALSVAWITIVTVYLYPGVKEEVDEKRYLHRVEKLHTPVLPLECGRARGIENRDFIREDRHSERCWVTIATFNSLYPEIAEATDLGATLRSNMRESLPGRLARRRSKSPSSCGYLAGARHSGRVRAVGLEPPMPTRGR